MTVISTLETYFTTSGSTFVRNFEVTRQEVESVFNADLSGIENDKYDRDLFNYMMEEIEEMTDMEFITAIMDERDGNFLIDYDDNADGFLIYKIDGRTLS